MAEAVHVRPVARARVRDWRDVAVGAGAFLFPVAVGAAQGGYFPSSWGWIALVGLWVAAIVLLLDPVRFAPLDLAFALLLAALAGWALASGAWSEPTTSVRELERDLVYLGIVLAALVLVRRASVRLLVGGLVAGISILDVYSLGTRLFPDRIGSFDPVSVYRLSAPVGYWNALGILTAMGIVLAVAVVARGETVAARAAAAASTVVLAPTLFFTYSRASVLALGIALVVLVALDPRRLQAAAAVCAAAAVPALAVWLSSRQSALTRQHSKVAAAAHQGHRLALVLLGFALLAAAVGAAFALAERRVRAPRALRLAFAALLAAVVVLAAAGAVAKYGSPQHIASRAWNSFAAPPPRIGTNLNQRLFSFSGNGRVDLWRAAWHDAKAHPVAGSGGGTYEEYWLRHRAVNLKVRDAHSLYVETLGELGIVGLALLVAMLAVPLVAAVKARRHPLVPFAAAAYVAFLAHAGVDWDWEVPVVTATALLCGVAILAAGRAPDDETLEPRPATRYGLLALTGLAILAAFVGLVGNLALARASSAAHRGDWKAAAKDARRAHTWAPWSSEPWQALGEAQLATGDTAGATASFRKAIDRDPHDWSLWFDLARAARGGEQREALATAARLDPRSPEIAELRRELVAQGSISVARK